MTRKRTFKGGIAIPPWRTLKELIEWYWMSVKTLSLLISKEWEDIREVEDKIKGILDWTYPIELDVALNLERIFKTWADFWMNMEFGYQEDLVRLKKKDESRS